MTPISVATNTPAKPIQVGQCPEVMVMTPDGQTIYVAN